MSLRFKQMFTERIGLKLASLFLSLVVFTHVYTEQEREWTIEVPLETANLSEALCFVTPPPPAVLVTVRGKGKDLIKLKLRGARAVVDLGGSKAGSVKRILSGADIVVPPNLNVVVADVVEPKVLSLEIDSRVSKMVRVVPVYSGELPDGFELSAPPEVEPDRVRATGARRVLAGVDYVNTEPVDVSGMKKPRTVEASLDVGSLHVAVDPPRVRVSFPVVEARPDTTAAGRSVRRQ